MCDYSEMYYYDHDDYKQAQLDAIFAEQDRMESGGYVPDDISELTEIIIAKTDNKINDILAKKMMTAPVFIPGAIPCGTCNECCGGVLLEPTFKDTDGKYYCVSCWDNFTDEDSDSPPMMPPPMLECDPRELSVPALQIKMRIVLGAGAVLPKAKPVLVKMFREYYM